MTFTWEKKAHHLVAGIPEHGVERLQPAATALYAQALAAEDDPGADSEARIDSETARNVLLDAGFQPSEPPGAYDWTTDPKYQTRDAIPSTDDLVLAAAWLDEQADAAYTAAGPFYGRRRPTKGAAQTRQSAAWLREASSGFPLTVTFPDDYAAKSSHLEGDAGVLLNELKAVIEYGTLPARTPVRFCLEAEGAVELLKGQWAGTGVQYGPDAEILLNCAVEPDEEHELLRALLYRWATRPGNEPRLASELLAELDAEGPGKA